MVSVLLIGGGNMGAALAACWRDAFEDFSLTVAETNPERRTALRAEGFDAPDELEFPEDGYDLVVLAVKPQGFATLAPQLPALVGEATLISIMAGVPLAELQKITPHAVRVMPNTPAAIGEGMSVLCAPALDGERLQQACDLFDAAGRTLVVENEALLHAVTALSGSGPAYLFAFMEALQAAGISLGLSAADARLLTTQTMRGAALLADLSDDDAATLRQQVTSPGGTTEAALKVFTEGKLATLVKQALEANTKRSKQLAE